MLNNQDPLLCSLIYIKAKIGSCMNESLRNVPNISGIAVHSNPPDTL